MTIQQAKENIGHRVTYKSFEGCSNDQIEFGVITSVNEKYVFVRYGSEIHSKATGPDQLTLG